MRDKSLPPHLEPGIYRHFKGDAYEVFGVIKDVTNGAEDRWMVHYEKLGESALQLCRSYEEFMEPVFREGVVRQRFVRESDDE